MLRTLLLVTLLAGLGAAELRLARIFSDHQVLQAGIPCPIWGWAAPGATIAASFGDLRGEAVAEADGRWRINLDPMDASAEPRRLVVTSGGAEVALEDVLVGEVWLCAGQSNMARSVASERRQYPQLPLGQTDLPLIRYVQVPAYASAAPLDDLDPAAQGAAAWCPVSAETAEASMASPFYFARALQLELGVPVGLVQVAVSGTTQTAWCARAVLDVVGADDGLTWATRFEQAEAALAKRKGPFTTWAGYETLDAAWHADPQGRWPGGLPAANFPSVLYHTQIHPLAPLAFRGALWNQGEGGPSHNYGHRLHAMVAQWRQRFGHDFHFVFSSLGRATTSGPPLDPVIRSFYRSAVNARLGEAQAAFGTSGTWVDIADLGNSDTHWGRKDEAGQRYADAALARVYGSARSFTGPQLVAADIVTGRAELRFAHTGDGLVYAPSIDGISGFVLQVGAELRWIAPSAVEAERLVFEDAAITADAIIAYAQHPNPHETLFNRDGFPAAIFQAGEGKLRYGKDARQLVEPVEPTGKARLHVAEVRASHVIVGVVRDAIAARVHLPTAWSGAKVFRGGQQEPAAIEEADGARFVTVRLDPTQAPVVVTDATADSATIAAATAAAEERF